MTRETVLSLGPCWVQAETNFEPIILGPVCHHDVRLYESQSEGLALRDQSDCKDFCN